MAAFAASLIGAGTSKSGWPMLKLTGSLRLRANSKTLRMPEDSMWRIRSAIQRACINVHPLPFKRFQPIFRSMNELVHQVVQGTLNRADTLRPFVGVRFQAA